MNADEPKTPGPGQLVKLAAGFYLLLALAAVPWLGSLHGTIGWQLFWPSSRPWIDLAAAAAAALVLLGLWEGLRRFSGAARQVEADLARLLGPITRTDALALALLSGFAEELFFRGAVQGSWGLAAATVLFALLHTGPRPAFRVWTLFAGLAGLLFGVLVLWRQNLLSAVVAHFLVNAINLSRLASRSDESARLPSSWDERESRSMASSQDVLARVEAEKEKYLEELKDYIRIPSISTDPAHKGDVDRASEFLLAKMRQAGLSAEKIATEGHPLVYAEWNGAPGKPTVLFYGHYDVQPVDPIELWRNPPFEPTVEGDRLVARGATDDKGQSYTHLKAVAAMLAERGSLPVNVKFLVEGEEEAGGESIERYVRADGGKRLACDCVMISDSSLFAPGQPALVYGLRGMAYMEIKVTGPARDLHSGTYGGAVWNPLNALCHIVARLRDPETGRILIPGFYDDVVPLADWERTEWASLPYDEEEYRREAGVSATFGEAGYTTRERTGGRPTCDVNGIFGGYMGKGAKTVLPSWGGAKVSMRLVPNQDPEKIARLFTDYVKNVAPEGVDVEVTFHHGGRPSVLKVEGPIVEAAMAAMEDVWGARPVRIREGGSIPIVGTFSEVLGTPVLLLGFGLNDDALHSPNEKFNISHFYNGIRSVVRLLDRLGDV